MNLYSNAYRLVYFFNVLQILYSSSYIVTELEFIEVVPIKETTQLHKLAQKGKYYYVLNFQLL